MCGTYASLYVKYSRHLEKVHAFEGGFKNSLEQYPIPIFKKNVYLRLPAKSQPH